MRGIVFTLVFTALFLLLLSLTILYLTSVDRQQASLTSAAQLERTFHTADTLATLYRTFLEIQQLSFTKNTNESIITLALNLPANLTNATAELNTLETFLEGTYANLTSSTLDVNHTRFTAPFLYIDGPGLNYSFSNSQRDTLLVYGNPNVTRYRIAGLLTDRCKKAKCAVGGSSWNWVACGASSVYVELNILDTTSTSVKVKGQTSGCVLTSTTNAFTAEGRKGGKLTVTLGTIGSLSPALQIQLTAPLGYLANLTLNLSTTPTFRAWLPIQVTVNNNTLPNLVLVEK